MAFGAWGGAHYALDVALLGVILGRRDGFVWLTFKGKIGGFVHRAYRFFRSVVVEELEVEKFVVDRKVPCRSGYRSRSRQFGCSWHRRWSIGGHSDEKADEKPQILRDESGQAITEYVLMVFAVLAFYLIVAKFPK